MTFYKEEKERIGNGRWVYVIGTLLFHFAYIQGQMNNLMFDGGPMFYRVEILLIGIFVLVGYLDEKLFYVKEQGKRVYIIKKYEIVPIKIKTMYLAKIRIMVETLVVLLAGAVAVYGLVVVLNLQEWSEASLKKGIVLSSCFSLGVLGVTLLCEGLYEEYRRK